MGALSDVSDGGLKSGAPKGLHFVAEHIGRFDLEVLAGLPGFGVESLTLAGGRKLSDERRMSGGPRPAAPQDAESGSAAEPLVASMAQDFPTERPTFLGLSWSCIPISSGPAPERTGREVLILKNGKPDWKAIKALLANRDTTRVQISE